MLDDLIAKIKALLGRSDEEDTEEEGTGVHSEQTGMLDTKTNMQKPFSGDDEEVDEAAEKRSKIIRIVVVIAILYFAYDEFMAPKPPPQQPVKKSRKKPKKKKIKTQATPTAVPTPTAEAIASPVPEMTPEPTPDAGTEMTPEPTPEAGTEMTPEPTPDAGMEMTPEPTPEAGTEMTPEPSTEPSPEMTPDSMEDPTKALDNLDKTIEDPATEEGDEKSDENKESKDNKAEGLSALGEALNKMKEKSENKVKFTDPPDYLITGRGLVYNCRGKHWACVDKKSYFQCAAHQKESKKIGKKPDCGTVAVYQTEEDCQVIQLHNINTFQPTDFCSP